MVPLNMFVARLGLRVLAGADRLDVPIRWVHVSELPDPSQFLQGGELLLLAGTSLRPDACAGYVTRVKAAGVAALGFGVTPVFDQVPPELVAACRANDLPLLEVAPAVTFESCAEVLYGELLSAELSEIRRLTEAQRALIRTAAGPSPLVRTLELLATHVGGWALLADQVRGREWTGGRPRFGDDVRVALGRVCASTSPASATMSSADQRVMIQSVAGPLPTGYALAVGAPVMAGITDHAVITTAASLLGLLLPDPVDHWPAHRIGRVALAQALAPGSSRWDRHAAEVFGVEDTRWRIVCARATGGGRAGLGELASLLGSPFVDRDGEVYVALVPESEPLAKLTDDLSRAGWTAGISSAYPAGRLGEAHDEAARLLRTALFQGSSVVSGAEVDGLAAALDMSRLRDYADRRFRPLRERRQQDAGDLLATLRVWLRHNGHWDRAAEELGVHRNTVRHRVGQIETALGCRLADADTRMELYLALRAIEEL
ncbi:PucR family transcriptional regulator [Nonomuraea sp. AD125B]|uniref:PucR family transcriptional regulator n=1 Tax=Nonomuraea sp. AD125B TaxID=3242897 RepID=UPI003528FAFD